MSAPVIREARDGDRAAIHDVTLATCEEGTVLLYPAASGARSARPWPEVRLLAVTPAARGHGIAGALMRACIGRSRASGADVLSLHPTDFMPVAMAMYERLGFVRAPEIDIEPAPGIVIKGYRLDLAGR